MERDRLQQLMDGAYLLASSRLPLRLTLRSLASTTRREAAPTIIEIQNINPVYQKNASDIGASVESIRLANGNPKRRASGYPQAGDEIAIWVRRRSKARSPSGSGPRDPTIEVKRSLGRQWKSRCRTPRLNSRRHRRVLCPLVDRKQQDRSSSLLDSPRVETFLRRGARQGDGMEIEA